jgi:hypothetical protein
VTGLSPLSKLPPPLKGTPPGEQGHGHRRGTGNLTRGQTYLTFGLKDRHTTVELPGSSCQVYN